MIKLNPFGLRRFKMNDIVQNKSIDLTILNSIYSDLNINTQKAYLQSINQFLDYCQIGINHIASVTGSQITGYIDYLKSKYKNSTVNLKIASLKSLFNKISVIYKTENPFEILKKLNIKTTQKTDISFQKESALSGPNIKILLNHFQSKSESINQRTSYTSKRNYLLINLLYFHGLRISEALNMQVKDISKQNENLYLIAIIGKGNKPRIIKIDNELYQRIIELHTEGYIFRGLNNKQLSRLSICQDIKRIAKRLLNKEIHLHTFRHSFATNMIELTNNISKVSKYLGHSDISITSKIYYHSELSMNDLNLLKA